GLTTWFACCGARSRAGLDTLDRYYDKEIASLAELGCPVEPALFKELARVNRSLSDIAVEDDEGKVIGFRRGGFNRVRPIVTRYRQAWASRHLDDYLRRRCEEALRRIAREYHRLFADKGRPPTAKQFGGSAVELVNQWFGG